ncbi:amidohydrolase family protein [Sandaracinus amylolyticus]|uniref:amidohydrolase family protein n=1 Tax=Sandaracinus amylolyticus TaxID=927083 RepID=UPI001F226E0F|nr:amidohydrolase family protein [Sandaracinus amylolyticus]UJR78744.1 N-ethylammeline chlorohydrolase [Sandaracinus amylolyticus]
MLATGCGDDDDGGTVDGGPRPDGETPDVDAQVPDGGMPDGGGGDDVMIVECPAADAPSLPGGAICETTAGDANLLITADVLMADGRVLAGGQVLVNATGSIVCADCDCASAEGASGATRVSCPDGVLSPGLVNAHEHMTYQGLPTEPTFAGTNERFEHRHDWRRGLRDHSDDFRPPGRASQAEMQWAELRMIIGGATAVNGSGGSSGLMRNLDSAGANMEGLGQAETYYQTFPLGDSGGTLRESGCSYSWEDSAERIAGEDAYTPHVSEGIDAEARNEFLCMRMEGANDLIEPQTAMIHGIGLLPNDIEHAAAEGTMLVWSPRSNISLYGDTARTPEYDRLGVPIAMGTDWIYSGSMNMLRELQCADELNAQYWDGYFSDLDLWRMATLNGAIATATDDVLGSIAPGRVADLVIFDGSVNALHRAVIDAQPENVALVLRGGEVLYGEAAVVAALPTGDACDTIDVCGSPRRACVMRETGMSLAALEAANDRKYQLFVCDGATPPDEPSCHPRRTEYPDAVVAMPSIDGSNEYDGNATADDSDGDGIANAEDNCPSMFNPIRPLDMGAQADADDDGEGDICDPCPLEADATTCEAFDPNDQDRDDVPDTTDNCPGRSNPDQMDMDDDGKGDACDVCPTRANPGAAGCPGTIYEVQDGTFAADTRVVVRGVVTAVASNGFYAQVAEDDEDYDGEGQSGVFVFVGGDGPTQSIGDEVTIDGTVQEFFAETQISSSAASVMVTGTGTVPAPVDVTPADVTTGGARAEALEGVLVRVTNVSVTNVAPAPAGGETAPTYEFEVTGGLRIDDLFFRLTPFATAGETFTSITGVLSWRRENSKLHPRNADDVVAGTAQLLELGPPLSYVREAGAGPTATFPTPLTVRLARAVPTATTVTITAGSGLTVADVTIPANTASAEVPVAGAAASPTPVTVTATLGGTTRTAQVRVLGATEAPGAFTLTPDTAVVRVGEMQAFTVTTDIPAPPGGTTITLAVDAGGTVPPSVTVPAGETTATFAFTAGASAAEGTLTATMGAVTRTADVEVSAGGAGTIVINEVDYDMPGAGDNVEFIELYNPGSTAFDLTGVIVVLVNGGAMSGPVEYGRVALSGSLAAGEYLVIARDTVTIPSSVDRVPFPGTAATDNLQNGPNDGIAILRGTELLDALTYEGPVTAVTISGTTYNLVEGTASTAQDVGSTASISRIPNGRDTNDAATDWATTAMVTPGAANVADPDM